MPFSNWLFYVKANSSPTNHATNSVTLTRHEASEPFPREDAGPGPAESSSSPSSSTTSDADTNNNNNNTNQNNETSAIPSPAAASSPTDPSSFSSSFPALRNLEATALYLSEKVKRIIRKNFSIPEDSPDSNDNVVDAVPLIKSPAKGDERVKGPYDSTLDNDLYDAILEEARHRLETATPRDRLRAALFKSPLTGEYSPELRILFDVVCYTFSAGLFIGYWRGRKEARKQFIQMNLATKYTSPMAANRKLQDNMFQVAVRNGFRYAMPLTGFMLTMAASGGMLTVLDGEEKAWHLVAGSSFAGANNRVMLGPRAFIGGGLVGGALGLAVLPIILLLREIGDLRTFQEIRYTCHVREVMEEMYEKQRLPAPPKQFELYHAERIR